MNKSLYKHFLWIMISACLPAITFAQISEVTIQEIQTVAPESLAIGMDDSPFLGDTVTTSGVVVFPPGLSSSVLAGGAALFIVDFSGGNEYSGLNVFTQANEGNLLAGFQLGDSIQVTGVIQEFEGSGNIPGSLTQLQPIEAATLLGFATPPTAVEIDAADLGGTTLDTLELATLEQWESVFVKITNVTVSNNSFNNFSTWVVDDANGNQAIIAALSDSLRIVTDPRGTGNIDASAAFVIPSNGSTLDEISGIVDVRFDISINPRFPSQDVVFGAGIPPLIANHNRNPAAPTSSDNVEVFVEISDIDGTVAGATLSYTVDSGSMVQIPMNPTTGDSFSAVIPAQANGSLVTYYIQATDNDNNDNIVPTGAPNDNQFLYYVRDGGVLIRDLQMNPFGGTTGYFGLTVTVNGITVSDSTDYVDRFFLQQGSGPWNGVTVFTGFGNVVVGRGDSVSITGRVTEFRDLTEIDNLVDFSIISKGNPLPEPSEVKTGDVTTGSPDAEGYESVLVRVSNVTITNANPDAPSTFGEFLIDDGTGDLRVDNRGNITFTTTNEMAPNFLPVGTTIQTLTGPLNFANDDFKLIPRNDGDFQGVVTAVAEFGPEMPQSFVLRQNYPNPFNPETTIQYQLGAKQPVQLKIFNILGQLVRTLLDESQVTGTHKIVWDGKNDQGISLPSGVYIYQLTAGEFEQSHKMILLK